MKYARITGDGQVMELFETENIQSSFHPSFLETLVRVSALTELGDFIVNGKNIGKRPSNESKVQDGEWVVDPEVLRHKEKSHKVTDAKERLKDLKKVTDPVVRQALEDLVLILS